VRKRGERCSVLRFKGKKKGKGRVRPLLVPWGGRFRRQVNGGKKKREKKKGKNKKGPCATQRLAARRKEKLNNNITMTKYVQNGEKRGGMESRTYP